MTRRDLAFLRAGVLIGAVIGALPFIAMLEGWSLP